MIREIVTVYPYEEKVPELSRIPEIPLFQRGKFSILYLNQSKSSPPFEKGRAGGIVGEAFSDG
jgi:hypothetical protein